MKNGQTYEKVLTANDTGQTKSHQAGLHIPKGPLSPLEILPVLDPQIFNPEAQIECVDPDGARWKMRFIYYNSDLFPERKQNPQKKGRDEFRITHVMQFFRKWNACGGDAVSLTYQEPHQFLIRIHKQTERRDRVVRLRGWNRVC